jgi:hexosaminidase
MEVSLMDKLRIDWERCPRELVAGLREIEADRVKAFTRSGRAFSVQFVQEAATDRPGFAIVPQGRVVTIRYSRKCDAFRAVGHLLGKVQTDAPIEESSEQCHFDLLGVLLDFSRNGVVHLDAARGMLRQMALLGYNCFTPYMEDTYEVPGEPFFGYLRGRYTQAELKSLDDYAHALGIEVFCSIQVLGHLEQVLQWPAYAALRDVPGVLLADHEPTYQLVEKMIRAVSEPVRSRRIFPGMDEAHGLGTGRYRRLIGDKTPFQILNSHMRRVCAICAELGLQPMTSSDMYFRLGSRKNEYYDPETIIPPEVIESIPPEMQLVYWDYYHTDAAFYEDWIERHRAMGKEPVMFGGVWTWSHFWAALPFSFAATDALMSAARHKGLRETIVTLWGDDGMQCDPFSALPGLAHYAQHAYNDSISPEALRRQFRGATGADFDDLVRGSDIDSSGDREGQRRHPGNASTWLLWDDPLLGLLQPQVKDNGLEAHHRELAADLERAARGLGLARRLRFPAQVARVLALKVDLRPKLCHAVRARDRSAVRALVKSQLVPLQREVDRLWKVHREMWMKTYRPFGWEVIEGRYGTLRARLQTLSDRLGEYVAGKVDSVAELETDLLQLYAGDDIYTMIGYSRAATASASR